MVVIKIFIFQGPVQPLASNQPLTQTNHPLEPRRSIHKSSSTASEEDSSSTTSQNVIKNSDQGMPPVFYSDSWVFWMLILEANAARPWLEWLLCCSCYCLTVSCDTCCAKRLFGVPAISHHCTVNPHFCNSTPYNIIRNTGKVQSLLWRQRSLWRQLSIWCQRSLWPVFTIFWLRSLIATRRYSTLLDATRRYSTLLDATGLGGA
jgi:hypothetical protein